ncbi:hypothetical protein [Propionivibrio sp.]|uniref:hypothetical protein n=1 Tax=Propionivibrio sp. TaxID=2212460 RepID=UPI00260BE36F|nr:hypothetical protein [Propionivibrio sp.]
MVASLGSALDGIDVSGQGYSAAEDDQRLENNQINELDPGFRRGDKCGNQAVMIFSQTFVNLELFATPKA